MEPVSTIWLCLYVYYSFFLKPGEPFTQEEMDEMLTALADSEKNVIYYKDIIYQLTIDPEK